MPPAADIATSPSGQIPAPGSAPDAGVQSGLLALALGMLAALVALEAASDSRMAMLLVLGALLGLGLYHAAFGFTSAYRRLMLYRDASGVNAQLVMLGLATLLFAPALASGEVFGQAVAGAVAPVGTQVIVGAFIFAIGMQLAGGCGSGTLYTLGGGSSRMVITLIAFCAGSFWASLHMGWWQALPSLGEIALGEALGWPQAVALQLAVLGVIWFGLRRLCASGAANEARRRRWLRGPWPLVAGAVALAILNFATLVVSGHPWSITWAFALWGAKAARFAGWDPGGSDFWQDGFPRQALEASVLADDTSMMDIGLVLGAFTAAALAGRYRPTLRVAPRALLAAALGGLVMGYGARIAFGCNVGAFFSGVASTSLHGWLWIAAAIPGTWIGVRLRPLFGLAG